MDHKTLFPVLEMGFCILDILMKYAIRAGCRFWQANPKFGKALKMNLIHMISQLFPELV
jgi:hypothetical protein